MNVPLVAGLALTALGLVGYVVGITTPYPGRAFSLTAIMIGITVALVSHRREEMT